MILVTGATGKLGGIVVQHLLKHSSPDQIAVLVRDEAKAADLKAAGVSVRVGHYDDPALLRQAMQGVRRVLLIAGTDEERRVQQHQNVIDVAKQVGVEGIAYTSRTLKDRTTLVNKLMEGHFHTEDDIQASGLNYAIFRNVLYMDVLPQFVGAQVFESGINVPAGQGRVAFALRSDMGEAIANSLMNDEWSKMTFHLTGAEAYSFDDVAAELTRLSGRTVAYQPLEAAAFEAQMLGRGVPAVVAQRVVGFITDIKNGQEDEVGSDLERLLGRRPTPLAQGLKTLFGL
jgi:NAD(P)H dehydrogenase (quinone)